jgi:hypothetical protein
MITDIKSHILKTILYFFSLFLCSWVTFSQTGTVSGIVKNSDGELLNNVSVTYQKKGTTTDSKGYYTLEIPAQTDVTLTFSHLTHDSQSQKINLAKGEKRNLNITLTAKVESIPEVEVISKRNEVEGITNVKVETIKNVPSANAGIEGIVKITGLGTSSDNALSTQYKVRGGNYDENLVYVNGIEIYRPFLVRSGQQEGLSFLNPDMTANVKFSSGGFQAKYGDKLSSVLDITYRKPDDFGITAELSLLGASMSIEGINKSKKTSAILGMRYRDNSLFVKSQDIETNYNPRFADIQALISHQFSEKWNVDFLTNFSINDYRYIPTARSTKFGTIQEPLELIVYYDGQENDRYQTSFGALNFQYLANENLTLDFTTSVFNTQEEEYFDIEAAYYLGTPSPDAGTEDYGESEFNEGIGSQLDHARNALDALIGNIEAKAHYFKDQNQFDFGVKFQKENIKDRLIEWQVIDSAGFSLRPPDHIPNLQPYEPYEGPLVPYQDVRATNDTDMQRISGFAQWNRKMEWRGHQIWTNIGVRAHQWQLEDYTGFIWSPRFQVALKPNWNDTDIIFRLSGGNYAQPPFYKELRNADGEVVPNVKAQQSYHVVLGSDLSFEMWKRPFKLVTEAYYKNLTDVNAYTLDNVRIRYAADNNAVAYAYGFDLRINGEFVPGTESWFNFGYLKTEENIDDRGYIARPSDQRLKFSLLFQDYVPSMPNLKMYLNLVYNTGVPGGSPTYADPYDFQLRLSDYKRADLGISYVFKDAQNKSNIRWTKSFKELSIGGEIFNMFNMQNAITNTWVRDIYSKSMYGVKNYMTGRVFNVKVKMAF